MIARLIKKDPKNAEFQLTDRYILNTSVSFKTKKVLSIPYHLIVIIVVFVFVVVALVSSFFFLKVNIAKLMETKSKKKEDGEKVEKVFFSPSLSPSLSPSPSPSPYLISRTQLLHGGL